MLKVLSEYEKKNVPNYLLVKHISLFSLEKMSLLPVSPPKAHASWLELVLYTNTIQHSKAQVLANNDPSMQR